MKSSNYVLQLVPEPFLNQKQGGIRIFQLHILFLLTLYFWYHTYCMNTLAPYMDL